MNIAPRLFVGSQGGTIPLPDGTTEREILTGDRCWTAAHQYKGAKGDYTDPATITCLLDSGAFSDDRRLSVDAALERSPCAWGGIGALVERGSIPPKQAIDCRLTTSPFALARS